MVLSSSRYRTKALYCEHRARVASDGDIRKEWQELATEWHQLADVTGKTDRQP